MIPLPRVEEFGNAALVGADEPTPTEVLLADADRRASQLGITWVEGPRIVKTPTIAGCRWAGWYGIGVRRG